MATINCTTREDVFKLIENLLLDFSNDKETPILVVGQNIYTPSTSNELWWFINGMDFVATIWNSIGEK